jgi:carnitine-CoA ligase
MEMQMEKLSLEERVLANIIRKKAQSNPDKTFILYKDKSISYGDFDNISNRIASSFRRLGVAKGDKVCIIAKNSPEFLYTWFGLAKLGAIEVPINTALKGDLLSYIINDSDAKFVVVDEEFIERFTFVEKSLTKVRGIIVRSSEKPYDYESIFPSYSYDELLRETDVVRTENVYPYDPIAIMYTSGTTGPSKGVVMPNRQFWDWGFDFATHMRTTENDVLYTCLPFFHGTSHFITTMMALLCKATLAIGENFSATRFWDEIISYDATWTPIVGAMASILYNQPPKKSDRNHRLKLIYSLPAPKEIYHEFESRFNVRLIEAYGLTEVNGVFFNPLEYPRIGSCGKLNEKYEVMLMDNEDNQVREGEIGEIAIRPKEPYSMMLEYYKKPEETVKTWRNLWFHTGDLGRCDSDGYYYFVDRKKDSLRRRGENVSSYEVEKVLNSHIDVLESAVVGVDSKLSEQEIMAFIRLRPDAKLAEEELIEFCQDRLAYFMIPRFIRILEDFPRTPNGKVEKYKLKSMQIDQKTWDLAKSGIKLRK